MMIGLSTRIGNSGHYTPTQLFANGEVGFWANGFNPASNRLFTSNNGITLATAAAQTVGLILDYSKILEAGSELLVPASWSITQPAGTTGTNSPEGTLTGTTNGTGAISFDQSFATVVGRFYDLTFTAGTGNIVTVNIGTSLGGATIYNAGAAASASHRIIFVATATTTFLRFTRTGAGSYVISSISCKSRAGNHAVQSTALSRPTTRQSGSTWYLEDDGGDSISATLPAGTYTRAVLNLAGTVTFTDAVAISGAEDVLQAANLVDVLYVNRAMTAGEKDSLTAYWT